MGKGILSKITWIANLVKMTESLTVKKNPTMRMWKVKKMLVRRSIRRLENEIQALLYEDSGKESEMFLMLINKLLKLIIFFSDTIKGNGRD